MNQPNTKIPKKRGRKQKKHPGGRPSKFSRDFAATICNLLMEGLTRNDACSKLDIHYQTMYLWLKRGEAENDLPEIKRSGFFIFWKSVTMIEANKRTLV